MKNHLKFLSILLIAAVSFSAFSQDEVVIEVDYMKVKPGESGKYLELEKEWKKIHEARLTMGHIVGWQLWEKMYSGAKDEYQYIAISWYENFQKTSKPGYWKAFSELYTEEEIKKLMKKTQDARVFVRTDVMHRVSTVENSKPTKFIVVAQMQPAPGMTGEYVKMEREIFKPVHEKAVERGELTTWSLWRKYPFEENDARYAVVNGFEDFSKLSEGINYSEIIKDEFPEIKMDELGEKIGKLRTRPSVQIWRLVDQVMPEPDHE
ncbi:MAG TPA: hypothetical protein ENI20_10300 [Bacteroides sp.]|nr:hypothetical protein [Bacteroides sp.]